MSNNSSLYRFILSSILVLFLAEIILTGSGQSIVSAGLSLRYLIFIVTSLLALFLIALRPKIPKNCIIFIIFLFYCLISLMLGIFGGGKLEFILKDFRSSFFIFSFFFLHYCSKRTNFEKIVIETFKYCCGILLTFHFASLALLYSGVDIYNFNLFQILKEDLVTYPLYYFYNGFVFYYIAFWYYYLTTSSHSKSLSFLYAFAVLLSFQRGLVLGLIVSFLVYFLVNVKSFYKKLILIFIVIAFIYAYYTIFSLVVVRDLAGSDSIRYETLNQVINNVNIFSFFFGHGFGIGVPIRATHFENVFLEIFHKQGVIGLILHAFILYPIAYSLKYNATDSESHKLVTIFSYTSLCFLIISLTNPFYQNPLGFLVIELCYIQYFRAKIMNLPRSNILTSPH